jgi:type I restriction enzyme S subunit
MHAQEQDAIVTRVKSLLQIIAVIENRVAKTAAQVDKVTHSILANAFRGELVPTEAELARQEGRDFEPAAALLERVHDERAAASSRETGGQRRAGRSKGSPRRKVLSRRQ